MKHAGYFSEIYEILYNWYRKCCVAGIYPFESKLQEEALKIKESLYDNRWTVLQPPMAGYKNGKPLMTFEKHVLPGKRMMFQSPLGKHK